MSGKTQSGPAAVLSEESRRITGEDALSTNLLAAWAVAESVRTTLGPRGMDKMLVDGSGDVVVTNDGVTLLEEMNVDHPSADALVDVATTQEAEVGDGTTTAAILAGELIAAAEDLLDEGLHQATVVDGYREAAETATETLADLATSVDPDDVETLERIADTAMTGKGAEAARDHLSSVVVDAVRTAAEANGSVNEDAVVVRSFPTASLADSRFVPGVLFDVDPCHPGMARSQSDADVLVYEGGIEASELSADAEASVSDFDEYDAFVERERADVDDAVDRILAAGADVVLADGNVVARARERFADAGVTAFYEVTGEERDRVAAATGADRVDDLDALTTERLGFAGTVERRAVRESTYRHEARAERTTVFDDLPTDTVGTVLLRGGTEHALAAAERAVEDGVDVVTAAIEDRTVLPGAGAPEMELARALRERADGVGGREGLAVDAFADAVEAIPRTLAENAGHDVVDALVELRTRHDAGERAAGFDVESGAVVDALDAGVVEPLRVETSAVETAVDAATTILRIDGVVAAGPLSVGDEE